MQETAPHPTKERHEFQAEVARLLQIMVHSVYSTKDIFLRELISNAADACEKLRYLALSDETLLAGDPTLSITVEMDAEKGLLTISDTGIGMSREELIDNLGTLARSGTRAFLDKLGEAKDGSQLIGQFGVGFYSAFMVASHVRVVSRRAGSAQAYAWSSDGAGAFEVEEAPLESAPLRGTRVTLTLLEEARDFANEATVEAIVRAHSAHVPVPIFLKKEKDVSRALTDGSALWAKPRGSIGAADYKEFYESLGGTFGEPALTVHYQAEGRYAYTVLLFVPAMKPFDLFDPARKGRVKLYVRRVFVTDEATILPPYLRFLRGIIDTEDLPLNISREMLQKNAVLETIGKAVTSRVLAELAKLGSENEEAFSKVLDAFGAVLKEGLYEAPERRDELFRIIRFKTTTGGAAWRSLDAYVADLKPNQTAIYYALGESAEQIMASPHLEGYRARGIEVLLLTDPIDAFWVRTALGFAGKPFQSITQGASNLDAIPLLADAQDKEGAPARAAAVATLAALLKESLGGQISDARPSQRLTTSPVCLVAPDFGLDRHTEKLLAGESERHAREKPVLEINPAHPLIKALAAKTGSGEAEKVRKLAPLLFGQAQILDGLAPNDPAAFAGALAHLMETSLGA